MLRGTLLLLFLSYSLAVGQVVTYQFTTIAGLAGSPGTADGLNSGARFQNPCGLTLDKAGNLYVTDLQNSTIRKISPVGSDWQVTTIAGTAGVKGSADGYNLAATFNLPRGIVVDDSGNLFVADRPNQTIRKLTPQGADWAVTTIAGAPGAKGAADGYGNSASFSSPSGITIDTNGVLYVADTVNCTIRSITSQGSDWEVKTVAGYPEDFGFVDGYGEEAVFAYPYFLTATYGNTVYIADWGNSAIRSLSTAGDALVQTVAGTGDVGYADGVGTNAVFNSPQGIAVDASGNVYVSEERNHTIRKITFGDAGASVTTIAGDPSLPGGYADGTGSAARFNKPWGIAVANDGAIFVADFNNHVIRKGTPVSSPAPAIQYHFDGTELVLIWPAEAADYVLETTRSVAAPESWSTVTNGITFLGRYFVVTNSINQPAGFYRLRKP